MEEQRPIRLEWQVGNELRLSACLTFSLTLFSSVSQQWRWTGKREREGEKEKGGERCKESILTLLQAYRLNSDSLSHSPSDSLQSHETLKPIKRDYFKIILYIQLETVSVSLGKDPAIQRISAYVLPSLSSSFALYLALLLCIIFTSLAFQKSYLYESCIAGALVSLSLLGYETRAAQPARPTLPFFPLPSIAYKLTKQTLGQTWGMNTVNENVKDQRNIFKFLQGRICIAIKEK